MNCLFSPIRPVTGLHLGDCRDVLRTLPDNSIDSVITDPPYALVSIVKRFGGENAAPAKSNGASGVYARASAGFMGQSWDTGEVAFSEEFWQEVYRVLKPGGHVASFGGTRTYHRMACAIEDAGFEIRDQLQWLYGVGFPKSHDVSRNLDDERCHCSEKTEQEEQHELRPVRTSYLSSPLDFKNQQGEILLKVLQEQGLPAPEWGQSPNHARGREPFLEGRCDNEASERELQRSEVRASAGMGEGNGSQGWIHSGTSTSYGNNVRVPVDQNRSCSSQGSQSVKQRAGKSRTMANQCRPQKGGGWEICGGCGKPNIPDGLGTALKPANEPICLARKPLSEKTVALNVLKWGTGALNIDACRIGDEVRYNAPAGNKTGGNSYNMSTVGMPQDAEGRTAVGRFPANVITDGSVEMPNGAQRFFYSAKASKADRGDGNSHPTVKPTNLMQWLCRLVTPPGGVVLDPFMGSGSTGKAAHLEGFKFVGIEREEEYFEIAKRRVTEC